MMLAHWRITDNLPTDQAYALLATDRYWNGYSIADLAPATRAWTTVTAADHPTAGTAACLLYRHPAFNALIPTGVPAGVAAILTTLATTNQLPSETAVLLREEHCAAIEQHYTFPQPLTPMLRMALATAAAVVTPNGTTPRQLTAADLPLLEALYASYPANSFVADQLMHGVFFGVADTPDRLLAAGGTHVVASEYGLAALGNIFVLPEARGRGLGQAVTATLVQHLLAIGYRDLILNVAVSNETARKLYQRLGFREHCAYLEGTANRR